MTTSPRPRHAGAPSAPAFQSAVAEAPSTQGQTLSRP